MSNPYYQNDADADLFGDSTHTAIGKSIQGHPVDGSHCPKCFRSHRIPEKILKEFSKYEELFEHIPEQAVIALLNDQDFSTTVPAELASSWLSHSTRATTAGDGGPLRTATQTLLDEMSGGRHTLLWKVFEAERQVLVHNAVLRYINNALERIRSADTTNFEDHDFKRHAHAVHVLNFICELMVERAVSAYNKYKQFCVEADMEAKNEEEIVSMNSSTEDNSSIAIMLSQIEAATDINFDNNFM